MTVGRRLPDWDMEGCQDSLDRGAASSDGGAAAETRARLDSTRVDSIPLDASLDLPHRYELFPPGEVSGYEIETRIENCRRFDAVTYLPLPFTPLTNWPQQRVV